MILDLTINSIVTNFNNLFLQQNEIMGHHNISIITLLCESCPSKCFCDSSSRVVQFQCERLVKAGCTRHPTLTRLQLPHEACRLGSLFRAPNISRHCSTMPTFINNVYKIYSMNCGYTHRQIGQKRQSSTIAILY